MSRKYCSVCQEPHGNTWHGMCDKHIEEEENKNRELHNVEADHFNSFMSMDDTEKWENVFEFMRSQGWSP